MKRTKRNRGTAQDAELDREIRSLVKVRRGRPRTGYDKAFAYDQQVCELIRSGMSRTQAVLEVAMLNSKHPLHIWACRKVVRDTDPHKFQEYDPLEDSWPDE